MPRPKDDSDKFIEELERKHARNFKIQIIAMKTFMWSLTVFTLYLVICLFAYRLGHPDQTETQLFFNIGDALLWRW